MRKYSKNIDNVIWDEKLIKHTKLPNLLIIVTATTETISKQRKERDNKIIETKVGRTPKKDEKDAEFYS